MGPALFQDKNRLSLCLIREPNKGNKENHTGGEVGPWGFLPNHPFGHYLDINECKQINSNKIKHFFTFFLVFYHTVDPHMDPAGTCWPFDSWWIKGRESICSVCAHGYLWGCEATLAFEEKPQSHVSRDDWVEVGILGCKLGESLRYKQCMRMAVWLVDERLWHSSNIKLNFKF